MSATRWFAALLLGLVCALACSRVNAEAPLEFKDRAEEQRFRALAHELRCVMCQNQSLADSDAQIAVDLRRQILQLMREGRNDGEIEDYLVERYGEFVLYQPRLHGSTWLLWFGPLLVLVAGGVWVWTVVRRQSRPAASADETNEEQEW